MGSVSKTSKKNLKSKIWKFSLYFLQGDHSLIWISMNLFNLHSIQVLIYLTILLKLFVKIFSLSLSKVSFCLNAIQFIQLYFTQNNQTISTLIYTLILYSIPSQVATPRKFIYPTKLEPLSSKFTHILLNIIYVWPLHPVKCHFHSRFYRLYFNK